MRHITIATVLLICTSARAESPAEKYFAAGNAAFLVAGRHEALGHRREAAEQYEVAAQAFQTAYEQEPRPVILYALGEARRALGDLEHAAAAYRQYLIEAPAKSRNRPDAEHKIAELETAIKAQTQARNIQPRGVPDEVDIAPPQPQPQPQLQIAPHENRTAANAAWGLLATGTIALGAGAGVLGHGLSIDLNQTGITVSDAQARAAQQQTETVAGGIVVGIGAAALAGAGAAAGVWLRSRPKAVAALVPLTQGGALVVGGVW